MIKAIVTDVEGTTSSISFVKDILFPYAKLHMAEFLQKNENEPEVAEQLKAIEDISSALDLDEKIEQLLQWMEKDEKLTPLKVIQGLIWEKGYKDGDFHGHIYKDAYEALRQWHEKEIKLYVYSSGSIHAQQLLFGHTSYGDITEFFSGYYDTKIGKKTDPLSYLHIIQSVSFNASQILFLSDVTEELDAAKQTGMSTYCINRETETSSGDHPQANDFSEIILK